MNQNWVYNTRKELDRSIENLNWEPGLFPFNASNPVDVINNTSISYNSKNPIEELLKHGISLTYKKNQLIYSEGNHAINLYYIIKGKIKTFKANDHGQELILDLYTSNEFMGYIPLLENSSHKETAKALEETELLIIPKNEFITHISNSIVVNNFFLRLLTKNINEQRTRLVMLAYGSHRKKVAEALLFIFSKYYQLHDENLFIRMNRKNLAAIAGTATESLIRTLTDFKNEKLIQIQDAAINIINRNKLKNLID